MILRFLLLGAVVMLAYGGVSVASRRQGRATLRVPPGITLIQADKCHQCVVAKRRFEEEGAAFQTMDADVASERGLSTLTVPTVYVGTADGTVAMTRRGTFVLSDIDAIISRANLVRA